MVAALARQVAEQAPSTAALLSRALGGSSGAMGSSSGPEHPVGNLRADSSSAAGSVCQGPGAAAADAWTAAPAVVLQSAPRSERSKPQLEEAIAAALRRGTTAAAGAAPTPAAAPAPPTTAAAECAPSSAAVASAAATSQVVGAPAMESSAASSLLGATPAASQPAPAAPAVRPAVPPQPALPPAQGAPSLRSAPCPPPPPAAPAGAVGGGAVVAAAAPVAVPPLRLVAAEEFAALPSFIRSQLPLDSLNSTLETVHAAAQERGSNGMWDARGWSAQAGVCFAGDTGAVPAIAALPLLVGLCLDLGQYPGFARRYAFHIVCTLHFGPPICLCLSSMHPPVHVLCLSRDLPCLASALTPTAPPASWCRLPSPLATPGFTMEDVQELVGAKSSKVLVNSLVKLGRVQLQVARMGTSGQGTLYLLV